MKEAAVPPTMCSTAPKSDTCIDFPLGMCAVQTWYWRMLERCISFSCPQESIEYAVRNFGQSSSWHLPIEAAVPLVYHYAYATLDGATFFISPVGYSYTLYNPLQGFLGALILALPILGALIPALPKVSWEYSANGTLCGFIKIPSLFNRLHGPRVSLIWLLV